MTFKTYIRSEGFKGLITGLGIAVAVLTIFQAGIAVGHHKTLFACQFGKNFEENFKDPRSGFFMHHESLDRTDLPGGHGAFGTVVSINLPDIVVAGTDNLEKTIHTDTATEVRTFRTNISTHDLHVGDPVIVLGTPNDTGTIYARLIRVLPPPPGTPAQEAPSSISQ